MPTVTTTTTTIFSFFPFLPPELRLTIWSLALSPSQTRTISITCHRNHHPVLRRRYAEYFSTSVSPLVPSLLHVNREARAEALRVYTLHFTTTHAPHRGIYAAFDRDVLYLREDVLAYLGSPELAALRWLVVDVADVTYFGYFYMDVLRQMGALRVLRLVIANSREVEREGLGLGMGMGMGVERAVEILVDEFQDAIERYPEWRCPAVKIETRDTGVVVGEFGG